MPCGVQNMQVQRQFDRLVTWLAIPIDRSNGLLRPGLLQSGTFEVVWSLVYIGVYIGMTNHVIVCCVSMQQAAYTYCFVHQFKGTLELAKNERFFSPTAS